MKKKTRLFFVMLITLTLLITQVPFFAIALDALVNLSPHGIIISDVEYAENTIDGVEVTYAPLVQNDSIIIDLGQICTVERWNLRHYSANSRYISRAFKLEYSLDGINFILADEVENNSIRVYDTSFEAPINARFFKFTVTRESELSDSLISEIELWGTEGGFEPEPEIPEKSELTPYLEKLIEDFGGLNDGNYSGEAWQDFCDSYENAETVSKTENATDQEIDSAITDLCESYLNLQSIVDKRSLAKSVARAKDILLDSDDYQYASIAQLEQNCSDAAQVLEDENATQAEVDIQNDALLTAILKAKRFNGFVW